MPKNKSWSPDFSQIGDVRNNYSDVIDKTGIRAVDMSDATLNTMYQLVLMQQQFGLDDQWWNQHDSPEAIYSQLRALGFSDAYISQYLLGNGSRSQLQSSPQSSGGSGSGAVENLMQGLNAASGAGSQLVNAMKADSEIALNESQVKSNEAQANLAAVNAGLRPAESASMVAQQNTQAEKNMSDVDRNVHLNNLDDKQVEHLGSLIGVESKQAKFYEAQAYYYNGITEPTIRMYDAETAKYYEECRTMKKQQSLMDSEIDATEALTGERNASAALMKQETAESWARTANTNAQNQILAADIKSLKDRGVLLTMDVENKVSELEAQGKYDEAEKLVRGQFKYMLARGQAQYWGSRVDTDGKPTFQVVRDATGAIGDMFGIYGGVSLANPTIASPASRIPRTSLNPTPKTVGNSSAGAGKTFKSSNDLGYGRGWSDAERAAYFKRVQHGNN